MAISLPLRARLAAQKLMQPRSTAPTEERPQPDTDVPTFWLRLETLAELPLYGELIECLSAEDPELRFLITVDAVSDEADSAHWVIETPSLHPQVVKSFLDDWHPEVIIWSGGDVPLAVLERAQKMSIPVINTEVDIDLKSARKMRMFSSYYRSLFMLTGAIFPKNQTSYAALVHIGIKAPVLHKPRSLKRGVRVLSHEEHERTRIVKTLSNRTVWLAEAFSALEVDMIIMAHRIAAKLTHRLMLVLIAEPEFTAHLTEQFDQDHLTVHQQAFGEDLTQDTHVYVVKNREQLGLWFRVVPLSFLGGFDQCDVLTNPLNAANLGSAIVFGPQPGPHDALYKELMTAGAAVQVNTPESLAEAVCQLSFPDRAAAMAHAGWVVSSEGAEATDAIVRSVNDLLYPELADAE